MIVSLIIKNKNYDKGKEHLCDASQASLEGQARAHGRAEARHQRGV